MRDKGGWSVPVGLYDLGLYSVDLETGVKAIPEALTGEVRNLPLTYSWWSNPLRATEAKKEAIWDFMQLQRKSGN